MKIWIIILIILIIVFALAIICNIIYNKYQDYIIKINEVEGKIDHTLRNKYDSILKINNSIKEKIKTEKEIVDDLENIKSDEKTSFEMYRILADAYNKVDFIKKQYKEIKQDKELNEIFENIDDMDETLNAYIKYYNENIVKYNNYIRKFPYNIIGIILKYKEKMFFDNKNLNDEEIKDFKI